jgi:hypothetical protein
MALGRPKVALILTHDKRMQLESLAHRSRTAAASGAARTDYPHVRRRRRQQGGREAAADVAGDGLQVARPIHSRAAGRVV